MPQDPRRVTAQDDPYGSVEVEVPAKVTTEHARLFGPNASMGKPGNNAKDFVHKGFVKSLADRNTPGVKALALRPRSATAGQDVDLPLKGANPAQISENIRALRAKGISEREAISRAHAHAKAAKK